jgi:acetyltransferase-like isoleucine patch superfamily enzyme
MLGKILSNKLESSMGRLMIRLDNMAYLERKRQNHKTLSYLNSIHPSCNLGESSIIHNSRKIKEDIVIGPYSAIFGHLMTFPMGGSISIGERCFVGEGSRIWSAANIKVGNYVLISHGVNIYDSNTHSTSWQDRRIEINDRLPQISSVNHNFDLKASPIVIEDDVWIGCNALILKGVRIGRGSIIGASAVITRDIPSFSVVVDKPDLIIKSLPYSINSAGERL